MSGVWTILSVLNSFQQQHLGKLRLTSPIPLTTCAFCGSSLQCWRRRALFAAFCCTRRALFLTTTCKATSWISQSQPRALQRRAHHAPPPRAAAAAAAPHSSTHAPTPALPHAAHYIPSRAGIASHT
eukprot:scaffold33265_cov58-Phaeocystis_antarctica.AAC.4